MELVGREQVQRATGVGARTDDQHPAKVRRCRRHGRRAGRGAGDGGGARSRTTLGARGCAELRGRGKEAQGEHGGCGRACNNPSEPARQHHRDLQNPSRLGDPSRSDQIGFQACRLAFSTTPNIPPPPDLRHHGNEYDPRPARKRVRPPACTERSRGGGRMQDQTPMTAACIPQHLLNSELSRCSQVAVTIQFPKYGGPGHPDVPGRRVASTFAQVTALSPAVCQTSGSNPQVAAELTYIKTPFECHADRSQDDGRDERSG